MFDKEDLHRLLPFSNDLPLALQMCYVGFYENASKEEVSDCEKAWERIADTLMRQVRWFVRPAPPPQPAVEEPPHPKLCSKGAAVTKKEPAPVAVVSRTSSYDSDYDEPYEEPVEEEIPVVDDYAILNGLTSNLERCQAAMTFLSIDSTPCSCVRRITRGNSTHKGEWEVVLRWPATLFSKMIKMTSEAGDRPKVMMQVTNHLNLHVVRNVGFSFEPRLTVNIGYRCTCGRRRIGWVLLHMIGPLLMGNVCSSFSPQLPHNTLN